MECEDDGYEDASQAVVGVVTELRKVSRRVRSGARSHSANWVAEATSAAVVPRAVQKRLAAVEEALSMQRTQYRFWATHQRDVTLTSEWGVCM